MTVEVDEKVLEACKHFADACIQAGYTHVSACYIKDESRDLHYMNVFQCREDNEFDLSMYKPMDNDKSEWSKELWLE